MGGEESRFAGAAGAGRTTTLERGMTGLRLEKTIVEVDDGSGTIEVEVVRRDGLVRGILRGLRGGEEREVYVDFFREKDRQLTVIKNAGLRDTGGIEQLPRIIHFDVNGNFLVYESKVKMIEAYRVGCMKEGRGDFFRQMICGLRFLHLSGTAYCAVWPSGLSVGVLGSQQAVVVLSNTRGMRRFTEWPGAEVPLYDGEEQIGRLSVDGIDLRNSDEAIYGSLDTLCGLPSIRGDLQGLVHMMLHEYGVVLPWHASGVLAGHASYQGSSGGDVAKRDYVDMRRSIGPLSGDGVCVAGLLDTCVFPGGLDEEASRVLQKMVHYVYGLPYSLEGSEDIYAPLVEWSRQL